MLGTDQGWVVGRVAITSASQPIVNTKIMPMPKAAMAHLGGPLPRRMSTDVLMFSDVARDLVGSQLQGKT